MTEVDIGYTTVLVGKGQRCQGAREISNPFDDKLHYGRVYGVRSEAHTCSMKPFHLVGRPHFVQQGVSMRPHTGVSGDDGVS